MKLNFVGFFLVKARRYHQPVQLPHADPPLVLRTTSIIGFLTSLFRYCSHNHNSNEGIHMDLKIFPREGECVWKYVSTYSNHFQFLKSISSYACKFIKMCSIVYSFLYVVGCECVFWISCTFKNFIFCLNFVKKTKYKLLLSIGKRDVFQFILKTKQKPINDYVQQSPCPDSVHVSEPVSGK